MADMIDLGQRDIAALARAARALPADLRAQFRLDVNREVVSPVAREVQAVAGRSSIAAVRAFRSRGVAVRPGEEPTLVVGGPEGYAGKAKMRTIAQGAEYGGGKRETTYSRKGRKRGRSRGGPHSVTRHTTRQFAGPGVTTQQGTRGRFVWPTLVKRAPEMTEAYLKIVERTVEKVMLRGQ